MGAYVHAFLVLSVLKVHVFTRPSDFGQWKQEVVQEMCDQVQFVAEEIDQIDRGQKND